MPTDAYAPDPKMKFTFGLWTVGNIGRDPFGEPTREKITLSHILELLGEVEHVMGDTEGVGHPPGVVDIGHRAAPRVRHTAPQLQGGAHDVVASLGQQRRRHRRIDSPRHGHQNAHGPPA